MNDLSILGRLVDELPVGVIVLDRDGRVVLYNRYEEALAGRERTDVVGRMFFDEVAPCLNVREFGADFADRLAEGPLAIHKEFSFDIPILDRPRDVSLRLLSFDVDDARYGIVMVEDISQQRSIARMNELLSSLLVHDLKNPLAVVQLSLAMLGRAEELKAPSLRELIERALRASDRLNRMLGTLLATSHLEETAFKISAAPVDLCELIEKVVSDMRVIADARGIRLSTTSPKEAEVVADGALIQRAIENLVENATRHAPRGHGLINVRLATTANEVTLSVEDNGPGIPEAMRHRIFERFVQVDAPTPEERGYNVGLGLTLVRMAARAHGGFVDVTCPDSGGAIFRLVLPRQLRLGSTPS